MLHLIVKEMVTQKKIAYLVPVILLPYFLTLGKGAAADPLIAIFVHGMCIAFISYFMTMYSNFNTNEGDKLQNRLLLSLPITRRSIVTVKYLMIGVWWLIAYTAYTCLMALMNAFRLYDDSPFDIRIAVLSLCLSYMLTSVFYPMHYRFGYRVGSMLGIVVFFLIASMFGKVTTFIGRNSVFPVMAERPVVSFSIIALVFVAVSYRISVQVFEKADF